VRLRNKGSDAVSLYRPSGDIGSLTVEPGEEFEIAGTQVTADVPKDADYVLVESSDGELRAYATSRWELVRDMDASPSEIPVPKSANPKVDMDVTKTEVAQPATVKDEG
jgi:hypothetical protein